MKWTWDVLASAVTVLTLVLAVGMPEGADATSFTSFEVQTGETEQVSLATGSGLRPTIGWTLLNDGWIRMTVAVKSNTIGWLGLGVSSSDGLKSSLMYGNTGGGAIIWRKGVVSADPVREYALLGPSADKVVAYDSNPVSVADVQKCVSDFCITEAQVCLGQALCSNALRCGQEKFGQLSTNNTINGTAPSNATLSSALAFVSECATPISNPKNPDQISALAALLDASGCVVSSCTRRILDKGFREPSLNSSSVVQDGSSTILTFTLTKRQIAGIPFNPAATTLMVAWANEQPGNLFAAHPPGQRTAVSLNMDSGSLAKVELPNWVVPHVALVVLGFGICFPLGTFLHSLHLHRFTWLPYLLLATGIALAAVGSVLVSAIVGNSGQKSNHAVIGIVAIVAAMAFVLLSAIQPPTTTSEQRAWDRVALVGVKENQIEKENKREFLNATRFLVVVLELATAGLAIGALFTGLQTIQDSMAQMDPAFPLFAYIALALIVAGVVLPWVVPFCPGRRQASRDARAMSSVAQISTNPGFRSPAVEVEAGVPDLDVIPLILSWEKVSFYAATKRGGGEPKQILKNAIGICSPRTLTAVLGPSGAGKSSLMEILALRSRRPPSPESRIFINGAPAGSYPGIHRLMGFVPQNDILHQYLTVLETLRFTAKMILPEEMSEQVKVERMLRVVAQLGLGHVLDTPVGGDTVRGLSGGERRRISIALQMLKSPSILFLDEPTSGLDAHLALRLVTVLRELANEGRTVFATIHQPSAACFELFDRVVLMSGGFTVWSGSRTACLQFIAEQKREVPRNWNPADWLLTVVDFKRDENERIVQATETGKTVYKTDKQTGEALKRKGLYSGSLETGFTSATSAGALSLDVSELRDNVKLYYQTVNPSKLKEHPAVVEEIVSFALSQGLDALDKKLKSRYQTSILPYFKAKEQRNLEPCTWEELVVLITNFASSRFAVELVDRIRHAKDEARSSFSQLSPGMNTGRMMERLDSAGTTGEVSSKKGRAGVLSSDGGGLDEENDTTDYPQPFMSQVRLLSSRSITLVWRNPQALKFQALQNIVFGILLGALYSNVKFLKSSPFQQSIVMAIILAMVAFVTLSLGTQVAFNDRLVLEREMSDSMYSPIAHFLQRLLIGIPVAAFIAMCLILPAYFWVGLQPDIISFFFFCLVNIAIVFLFDSVVFALTLLVSDVNSAYAIGNFYEALTVSWFLLLFSDCQGMTN